MSKSAFLTARIEPKLKQRASQVLGKVGVSTTDAITMFFRQVVLRDGLPFDVQMPNPATGIANEELGADRGKKSKKIFNGVVQSRTKRKREDVPVLRDLNNTHY
jgi:DNA-damage-inducible protein J